MMILDGRELAGYIKERQYRAVRQLADSKVIPKLAIIVSGANKATSTYIAAKQKYGADIGVQVDIHDVTLSKLAETIKKLNSDTGVHGMIVQLPLPKGVNTDEIVNLIEPAKDVDGLGKGAKFQPATPTAILWLLAGYNIELDNKQIIIVGKGRLVGAPLYKSLRRTHKKVTQIDEFTEAPAKIIRQADVVISATGAPNLIKSADVKAGAVVIDAGAAEAAGKLVGDAQAALLNRKDIKISPVPGGVGPLTVCALFENVITAATI